jgi:hypothetical protein
MSTSNDNELLSTSYTSNEHDNEHDNDTSTSTIRYEQWARKHTTRYDTSNEHEQEQWARATSNITSTSDTSTILIRYDTSTSTSTIMSNELQWAMITIRARAHDNDITIPRYDTYTSKIYYLYLYDTILITWYEFKELLEQWYYDTSNDVMNEHELRVRAMSYRSTSTIRYEPRAIYSTRVTDNDTSNDNVSMIYYW